jgi:hypothetical protein
MMLARIPRLSFGIVLLLAAATASAQEFSISKVELAGNNVVVYYDLVDSVARVYSIMLYASTDSYASPLKEVTGDVGLEVPPGRLRKITWNAQKELGATFKGELNVEVRGKVYIPFVKLDGFDFKTFKRGKSYKIIWTGGRGNSVLNFDLYRGEEKVTTYPNVANVGHYDMAIGKIKPGTYKLRISDAKNKDDVVYSSSFKVKRKIPLLLTAAAAAGVVAGIVVLWPDTEEEIPDPITPND